jgi:uncharacterized protein YhfF
MLRAMDIEILKRKYPGAETFRFGDTEALCRLLTDLVRAGKKSATCERAGVYDSGAEARPEVGRRDIALNWDGTPALVTETVRVDYVAFKDVTWDFAKLEGENDDLDGWRGDHRAYFERSGGFSEEMLLMCERFRVVEVMG